LVVASLVVTENQMAASSKERVGGGEASPEDAGATPSELPETWDEADNGLLKAAKRRLPRRFHAWAGGLVVGGAAILGIIKVIPEVQEAKQAVYPGAPTLSATPINDDPYGLFYFAMGEAVVSERAVPTYLRQMHSTVAGLTDDGQPNEARPGPEALVEGTRVVLHNPSPSSITSTEGFLRLIRYEKLPERCVVLWRQKGMREAELVEVTLDPETSSYRLWGAAKFIALEQKESQVVLVNIRGGAPGVYTLRAEARFAEPHGEYVASSEDITLVVPSEPGGKSRCLQVIGAPRNDRELPHRLLAVSEPIRTELIAGAGAIGLDVGLPAYSQLLQQASRGDLAAAQSLKKKIVR
jgi:hypothetical protein